MQPRNASRPNPVARREFAGLVLSESGYAAGLRQPRHGHEPASFSLVLEGGYSETVGQKNFDCRPATVVFRPPAESHSVAFADAPVRIFRLDLLAPWLERLGVSPTGTTHAPAAADGGARAWLALRLYRELREMDEFSPLAVEGLALELWAETARGATRGAGTRPPRWLARAREMLREQPAETLTLGRVAEEVGVHPSRLAHEFRRCYRVTAGEYLRRLRVERAARSLAGTDLSLSEVATAAGFYDQSHMTNAFKRATGATPAEYRAAFRAPQSRPT